MEGVFGFILGIACVVLCGIFFHRAHNREQVETDSQQNYLLWKEKGKQQEVLDYIHRQISEMNESIMKIKEQIAAIESDRSVLKEYTRPFAKSPYEDQVQPYMATGGREYASHRSSDSVREKGYEETTDPEKKEKEILYFANQNLGAIEEQLRSNGYLIEKWIEIFNGADVINSMELPIMKENQGGIIGLISSNRRTGEYFAVPIARKIPKSQQLGGAFRYLFDWKNAEGISEVSQHIAILRIEKLPRVIYSQEQKGYQMVQGTKGRVTVEN